ncbi:MAG: ABC transporter permease [Fibrobacterales bacterium]
MTNNSTPQNLTPFRQAVRRLVVNKAAIVSLFFLFILAFMVFVGPYFLQDPYHQNIELQLQPPSMKHFAGTDQLGRDLWARIFLGGRLSLAIGFFATLISIVIGTSYGAISGYYGGRLDQIMMRIVDLLYSLPYMFLVIILIANYGKNIYVLFAALGAVQWLTTARIVRSQVLSIKHEEYILATQALGLSTLKIIFKHIIPNIIGIVIVYATLTVPAVILQEAFLSFLGLNVQECTWGVLASEGASQMDTDWWLIVFPGSVLTLTLLSFNFIGDGLRDALDPKD